MKAKRIDPYVVLPKLIGIVLDVPYGLGQVMPTWVRPPEGEAEAEPPDSAVVQLDDQVRDALASVTAERIPDLAARWANIEEFRRSRSGHDDVDYLAELISGLAALSQRAQLAGEHVYCWWAV